MKRKFVKVMFFGALALSTVTYVGCKDYDDDIDNLQTQIDAVKVSLEELQTKVNSGSVITNVVKGENGITVTLSDGKSYELTNGKNGADADVWTIGEKDGYWYKNGVKTEYKAVGVDGAPGAAGPAGGEGTPGENGKYYVPNKETGCFDIYQDGKLVEATDISWKTAASEGGVTAVLNGNVLTLQGVEGAPDGIAIDITSGIALSSIAFIPDVVSTDVPYATTSKPFYHIESYLNEAKFNTTSGEFIAQKDWGKSNVVALNYRLNPEDANVDGKTVFGFIDRKVKTRAVGDKKVLLNVDETKVADGVVTIGTTINPNALAQNAEYNIAALQAWYGQKPMTSDYVYATSSEIDLVLADSVKTKEGDDAAITFYERTKSINKDGESDDFIKQFVALDAAANATFKYDATINLKDYVGLYSNDKDNWLAALGFKGMSYEFSIPENYLAEDDEKTNQQWFIVKEGENIAGNGVIKVNPEVKNGTPAIGRTPVVRVDAFLTSNAGENIFTYYNKVNNVKALQFQWASGVTGVSPSPLASFSTDQTVKLTEPMTERDDVKNMTYQVTLENGETCDFAYNIVFINPFVATKATGIKIFGNGIGVNTGATMPEVLVKDNEGSAIYSYSSTATVLVLSDKATNTYKLNADMVSVEYAFVEEGDWAILDKNMSANSELKVNATTGVVTWKNEGSTLTRDYNLTVIATVTFKDLSVVKCEIPVTLTEKAIK